MAFKYTGKPLTSKQADAFLKRIYLKPKAIYDWDESTGRYKRRKKKMRGIPSPADLIIGVKGKENRRRELRYLRLGHY